MSEFRSDLMVILEESLNVGRLASEVLDQVEPDDRVLIRSYLAAIRLHVSIVFPLINQMLSPNYSPPPER